MKEPVAHTARGSIFAAFVGTSLSSVLVTALTFVSGVLIARALGPEGRGDYGAVLLVASTAAALGCLSFFDASVVHLQRRGSNAVVMLPTMMAVALAITVLSSGAMMLALPLFDLRLTEVSSVFLAIVCFLIIATQLLIQCFSSLERSQLNFWMINVERVGAPAVFSLLVVAVWLFAGTRLSATIAITLFVASKLPVVLAWLSHYRKHLAGRLSWGFAKDTFMTGLKFHVAFTVEVVAAQLDRLIAVATWPKDLLGQYFVAFSAVGAGYAVVTTAMNTVLLPYLGGLAAEDRTRRLSQIIRLTMLLTAATVLIGWLVVPRVLPLLYGTAYTPAVDLSLWLLLALSILPLRSIVLETGRSLGKGWPAIEMAVTSIVTMYVGYLLTGYATPTSLITTFGLSHVASTLAGARHMVRDGDIRIDRTLVPAVDDILFIQSVFSRLVKRTQK